jgi:hypothetical protein
VSEIEDLLANDREQQPVKPRRGSRVALLIAAGGLSVAFAAAALLGVSATASIISAFGLDNPSPTASAETTTAVAETALTSSAAPGPSPVAAATIAEPPIYDASTDIATIPRPPADWSADQLANAEIWLTQSAIIGDCMLEKGYEYHFTPSWQGSTPWKFADQAPSEALALWGPTDRGLGDDYDWRDAGCQGYAVHVTGMDDAH